MQYLINMFPRLESFELYPIVFTTYHRQKYSLWSISQILSPSLSTTAFSEFYPSSKARGKLNLDDVKDFLRKSAPCEGNTDVWRPLYSHYLLQNPEEFGNVFIITDGHIDHEAQTLKNIADNSGTSRIFTFGVG